MVNFSTHLLIYHLSTYIPIYSSTHLLIYYVTTTSTICTSYLNYCIITVLTIPKRHLTLVHPPTHTHTHLHSSSSTPLKSTQHSLTTFQQLHILPQSSTYLSVSKPCTNYYMSVLSLPLYYMCEHGPVQARNI